MHMQISFTATAAVVPVKHGQRHFGTCRCFTPAATFVHSWNWYRNAFSKAQKLPAECLLDLYRVLQTPFSDCLRLGQNDFTRGDELTQSVVIGLNSLMSALRAFLMVSDETVIQNSLLLGCHQRPAAGPLGWPTCPFSSQTKRGLGLSW